MPNISQILPTPGNTLPDEIKCYALPYGALGFVSHLLTYYTIACVCIGVRPYQPWKGLQYDTFNLVLAILGLLGGIPLSIFTMVRCHSTWQLLLMAMWKSAMSITNGAVAIHAALARRSARGTTITGRRVDGETYEMLAEGDTYHDPDTRGIGEHVEAGLWIVIYILGVIIGSVGLISLVHKHSSEPHLSTLTTIFAVPIVIMLVLGTWKIMAYSIVVAFALYAFYSDWAVGLLAHNIGGLPSSDVAPLYYTYLILKRFTMFSF